MPDPEARLVAVDMRVVLAGLVLLGIIIALVVQWLRKLGGFPHRARGSARIDPVLIPPSTSNV